MFCLFFSFRTRVHAQRKFAQGQGSSSYVTNFPTAQQTVPVKESSEPPPELLPNLRPKPEDFLTFLCFRGTSVLPPHLDYFNRNKKSESETKDDSTKVDSVANDAANIANRDKGAEVSFPKPSGSGAGKSGEVLQAKDLKIDSKDEAKPSFIPFAVRKHAETVSDGKRRQTVQALKRKYQEQRLAKTQVQNRRTRSSGKDDDLQVGTVKKKVPAEQKADQVTEIKKVGEKKVDDKKVDDKEVDDKKMDDKKVDEKKEKKANDSKGDDSSKRKTSLRNTRNNPPKEEEESTSIDLSKTSAKKKTKNLEDEEKVTTKSEKKPILEATSTKDNKKQPTKTASQKQQVTRQQSASLPQSNETKSRSGHGNDEGEFSDSSDDKPLVNALKKIPSVTKKPGDAFSLKSQSPKTSDTEKKKDQPVATSTSKSLKRQSPKPTPGVSRRSCGIVEGAADKRRSESVSRKSDTSEPRAKKKSVGRKKKEKGESDESTTEKKPVGRRKKVKDNSDESSSEKKQVGRKKKVRDECEESSAEKKLEGQKKKEKEESDDSSSEKDVSPKKKLNEKRSQNIDDSKSKTSPLDDDTLKKKRKRRNEFTELGNVDDSDACRLARPSRKTKEAAAIYMELIGQKLNLDDFDDDGFSMDSFPELPNVKKTQQMENKLKANIGKPSDVKASPKKNKPENKPSKSEEKEEPIADEPAKKEKGKVGRKKKILSPNKDTPPELKEKSLQKSFSDSDDEPLAVKITKKPKVAKGKSPKKSKDLTEVIEKMEEKTIPSDVKVDVVHDNDTKEKTVMTTPPPLPKVSATTPEKSPDPPPKANVTTLKIPTIVPKASQMSFESVFKTPAETSSQLLSPSICTTPLKPSPMDIKNITTTSSSPKSITTTHDTKSNLPNLMPSAEESGKIFGIASVTLAQSSGPNDTKCTLGKCGSIHIPTLGPVIPTELPTADPTTSKEKQRRAKVNMSRAQIQKWILECARAR